ncbi:hypothetical protein CF319_g9431 [Tilletia indica]|nr:hypothetical protein CF319_g9431 [Tilletia indica]
MRSRHQARPNERSAPGTLRPILQDSKADRRSSWRECSWSSLAARSASDPWTRLSKVWLQWNDSEDSTPSIHAVFEPLQIISLPPLCELDE